MFESLNWVAVLVTAIITMVIGGLWYSPVLFGKIWMKLSGRTQKDMKNMKMSPTVAYIAGFLTALITSIVLAVLVNFASARTFVDGALVGVLVWIGFVATTQFGVVLWDNKPVKLFVLNTVYSIVTLVIAGGILAVWV